MGRLSNTVHDNDDSNDGRDVKDGNGDNDGVNNDMRDSTINGNTKSVDAEQKQGSNSKTKAMDSSSQNSNANYESDVGKDIDRDIGDEDFKKKSLDGEWVEVDDEKGADEVSTLGQTVRKFRLSSHLPLRPSSTLFEV